jgi:hypothetical protein
MLARGNGRREHAMIHPSASQWGQGLTRQPGQRIAGKVREFPSMSYQEFCHSLTMDSPSRRESTCMPGKSFLLGRHRTHNALV